VLVLMADDVAAATFTGPGPFREAAGPGPAASRNG
jgi:hypothetical protein